MSLAVSHEDVQQHRFHYAQPAGDTGWINHYFGQMKHVTGKNPAIDTARTEDIHLEVCDEIYPVAFLVAQDPGHTLGIHFHQADQFQVVLPCDGKFGKAPIEQPIVHFAAACSPYGPLTSGAEVLKYYTLRNGYDPGACFLPATRPEQFRRGRKPRSAHEKVPHRANAPITSLEINAVMPKDDTGLFATYVRLPPGAMLEGADPKTGRGQYWLVLSGSCTANEKELDVEGLCFVKPDDAPLNVRGGIEGAALIAMQFPRFS